MKNYVLFFIFLTFFAKYAFGHGKNTHKYMTYKAYYVLKKYVGPIPEMEDHLGSTSDYYNGDYAFQRGCITTGAYREDEEDLVYGYDGYLLSGLGLDFDDWIVSITHFWDADYGDNTLNYFYATTPPWHSHISLGYFPNSYTKLLKYSNPNRFWEIKYKMSPGTAQFRLASGGYIYITQCGGVGIEYNSLVELYKTGKAWITGYYNCPNADWQSCNYEVILGQGWRDALVWEILGRMCHLLEDLSVPAHANKDEHGYYSDPYEDYMSNFSNYSLSSSEFNSIPFINPYNYQSSNPLHFLMYVVSQVSDHFASRGEDQNGYSDNNLGGNGTYAEKNYINSNYPLYTLGKPITRSEAKSGSYNYNIKNQTYHLAIGATAGLLYWFAKETGILPPPPQPLTVSISGPSLLNGGQTGTWTANASGGKTPYHYHWEYFVLCDEPYIYDDRNPDSVPCGYWFDFGSDSKTASRSDWRSFKVKVTVTDANNSTAVAYKTVNVSSNSPQLAKNNSEQYMAASLPKNTKLFSNYPNPFNPVTTIKYQLKENGFVSLKIYDILGKEVAELINENKNAGFYRVSFDASNLPSGLYIYRMRVNDYVESKKMLLTK